MIWKELANATLDEVLAWADAQAWCRAMTECQQDAQWHAEGDVWTHTKLVCQALTRLDEWCSLPRHEQNVLIFTALLHDAGKPLTSQIDSQTGRVTSPKHAMKGEHLARSILRELKCDLATRETIARMVRFHGRPAFLFEKSQPIAEVISLSWLVTNRLLYLFALADTRGRQTTSMNRPEENLRYWRLLAEEQHCFDAPYPFANDQARFLFYRQPNPDLFYVPHEQYGSTVTMMSGLPGSGKDRWLSVHRKGLPVVSLDELRTELEVGPTDDQGEVAQLARERCRQHLRAKTDFAFNATNLLRQTRQRWIELFADYHARIEITYLEPPLATVLGQNKCRDRAVPERVIKGLNDKSEPPTWTECHQLQLSE
jgi:predicted kinase